MPSLWLINYVLPQRGHREAQRFLELGLRPKPQTHCRRQPKTSLRLPCALSVANQLCLATKGAQRSTKVFRVGAPPQTPDSLPKAYPLAEGNREATATVVPKTSLRLPCALSVANQFCLATKGAQRGTKVFRAGAPPQTPDSLPKAYPLAEGNREATATVVPKTSLRPPCAPFAAKTETVNENPATESSLGSLPQH